MITLTKDELEWLSENGTGRMKRFAEVHKDVVVGDHTLGIDQDILTVQAGEQRVSRIAPSNWTPSASDLKEDLGYEPKTI